MTMDRQQRSQDPPSKRSDRFRHLKAGLLVTAATLVSLIVLDTSLRFTSLVTPRSGFLKPVPNERQITPRTVVFSPGYRGVLESQDFKVDVVANSEGFRERELDRDQIAAQRPIVFIGDSYFFGWGVQADERISEQTGKALKRAGIDVAVVNLAFPGWGTFNYLDVLSTEVPRLKPRLVVIGSFIGNDFMDDRRVAERQEAKSSAASEPGVAVAIVQGDGGTSLKGTVRELLRTSPTSIMIKRLAWQIPSFRRLFNSIEVRNDRIAMYEPGQGPQQDALFAPTKRALGMIASLCRAQGITLVVALVPDHLQILAPEVLDQYDIDKPQRVLSEVGAELGLQVVDMRPSFLAAPNREQMYFRQDKHWTRVGHAFAADLLAKRLITVLSQPRPGG
jgi:hypothetical protein